MSEHEEYTAENYPSFGKKYANEKAIIKSYELEIKNYKYNRQIKNGGS